MPAWRSASMLLIARLTTEVSICANSTPSDVATRTSPAFVSLAAAFGSMVTLIISFLRVAPGASRSKVPHVAARLARFRFREGKRMFVVRNIINSDRAVLRLHRSLLAMWVRHRRAPTRFLHSTRCSAATRVVKRLTGKVKAWFLLPLAVEEITHELSGFQGGHTMRKASTATVALIVAIALFFAMSWGLDGFRALTSPNYGLDDVWRSQLVFDAGRLFFLSLFGFFLLVVFFVAMKLAVAGICVVHIADRFRAFAGGNADPQILEGALAIIVVYSFLSVAPA